MPSRLPNSHPCSAHPARELVGGTSVLSRALVALIGLYQAVARPLLPSACRFAPSCSAYARDAVRIHGAGRGLKLAGRRVLRCHPYSSGGYDPVPVPDRYP